MTAGDLPDLIVRLRQLRPAFADDEEGFIALEKTIFVAERTEGHHPERTREMAARALAAMLDRPPEGVRAGLIECASVAALLAAGRGETS